MTGAVSSKGQVTIPVAARRRLGLHAGSMVHFVLTDSDHLELIPVEDSVKSLKGMVPRPKRALSLEEMDQAIAEGARR